MKGRQTGMFDLGLVYGLIDRNGLWLWFRPFGRGVAVTNGPLLFSERYGYAKFLRLPFGWRAKLLKKRALKQA